MITVKKLYVVCGMLLCLVLAGCGAGGKDKRETPENVSQTGLEDENTGDVGGMTDEETTTDEISENDTQIEEPDMTLERDYDAVSNDKHAWYIVRKENHEISDCDHSFSIEQYDGYYANLEVGDEKVIYLTFDCGYENGYTETILDILAKNNAKACFFVTQTYIRDNVDIVKRMKEEGHQVGNHTVSHPSMPDIEIEKQKEELSTCADYMKEATGYEMDKYFRPPSGEYSERVLQLAKDMGYKTIFWSMAYMDYDVNNQPGKEYVVEHFNKYYHSGAIPLMHNVSESNCQALEQVLENLSAEGYRFASLDEMFQ